MASIDDLFKKPALPGTKRKLEATRDPNEIYKAAKLGANGDAKGNGHASVEDEELEDEEAGPELPPDEDELEPDDEEGRFFGGGISNDTADVLDLLDEREQEIAAPEVVDSSWLRKTALNFERRISKNAELRAKFEDDPQKFMGSEADLDADIKALSILSEHPEHYDEFARLGCVNSLVSLLAHENTDIAIDAIEIINELTDEDVDAEQSQWDAVVDAMIEADLLDLLISNFSRFKEDNEADRNGVYYALGVLENLSSKPPLVEKIGKDTTLLNWLLARIQKKESPLSQNKQYSAEILAILLQSSVTNRKRFSEMDGVDVTMQLLSPYRKRDPEKGTEEEYVENLFDCLTCVVDEIEGKEKFLEGEGVELCLIMLREGQMSKLRALRVLDHSMGGRDGGLICEKLVEAAGLKTLFGMFMKKQDHQSTEHILGIFASLLRHLPADSAARIRTQAKFVEKDYEKIEKLIKLRKEYAAKLISEDDQINKERQGLNADDQEDMADEWFSRRLEAGLYCLRIVDVVLAWLVAEDNGAKKKIRALLAQRDESLSTIKTTLQEQLSSMENPAEVEDETFKDMLETLVGFL